MVRCNINLRQIQVWFIVYIAGSGLRPVPGLTGPARGVRPTAAAVLIHH